MALIKGVGHIILYVDDMATEVKFYRDVLGLQLISRDADDFSTEMWALLDAGNVRIALHGGGKAPHTSSTPKLVFEVDDIHRAHAQLVARGVNLSDIREEVPGILTASGKDPEGILFSIDQQLNTEGD